MPVKKNQKIDLFERIRLYNRLVVEQSEMEDNSEYSIPDLYEMDDEYAGLCVEIMDLQDTIAEMLIDSKYAPLIVRTDSESGELDFFIKSSDLSFDQNIEKHLNFRLLTLKEEMKKRLKNLKILRLVGDLDPHVRFLYDEVVRSFISGAFEASSVLCRAISEFLLKNLIASRNLDHLLRGKQKDLTKPSLGKIAKEYKLLSKDLIDIYYDIAKRADEILHEKDSIVEEKHAFESIELLQNFIKEFPR